MTLKIQRGEDGYPFVGASARVSDMDHEFMFVSDSQDVEPLNEYTTHNTYDSFFVIARDGDYIALYGMYGIVPVLHKNVYCVFDYR